MTASADCGVPSSDHVQIRAFCEGSLCGYLQPRGKEHGGESSNAPASVATPQERGVSSLRDGSAH